MSEQWSSIDEGQRSRRKEQIVGLVIQEGHKMVWLTGLAKSIAKRFMAVRIHLVNETIDSSCEIRIRKFRSDSTLFQRKSRIES